jgi:hypothetical protein
MHGDHVRVTRDHWTENAESYAAVAPGNWQSEPSWGSRVPEAAGGSCPALPQRRPSMAVRRLTAAPAPAVR